MRLATFSNYKILASALLLSALIAAVPSSAFGQVRGRVEPFNYDSLIASAAARYRLDLPTFRALVHQESSFRPCARSPKGAVGLTQLMPQTAARFGVRDLCDPAQNIEGGARYLRWLLDYFGGNYTLALAGYNAGEGAVVRYGNQVPPYRETQDYVVRVQRTAMLIRSGSLAPASSLQPRTRLAQQTARAVPVAEAVRPVPPKVNTSSRYFWSQ